MGGTWGRDDNSAISEINDDGAIRRYRRFFRLPVLIPDH